MNHLRANLWKIWRLRWVNRWALFLDFLSSTSMLLVFFLIDRFQTALVGTGLKDALAGLDTSYFGYVALGLAVSELSTSTLGGVLGQFQTEKRYGTMELHIVSGLGLHRWAVTAGISNLFHAVFRFALIYGIAVGVLGLKLPPFSPGTAVVILLLAIVPLWTFSVFSLCSVLLLRKGNVFGFVSSLAFELLSGVYVPLDVLPEMIRPVAELIPITPALRAMQKAIYGGADLASLGPDITKILLHAVLYVPLAWGALYLTDRAAKKRGHYVLE